MKVLIVEDETAIREAESAYLTRAGYAVTEAPDGLTALDAFGSTRFDLVVLDLNLPGLDGVEVCRRIRETSIIPIIMVTARTAEIDELLGLDTGADDYLKKPFNPQILVARVKALLRRHGDGNITAADLHLDPESMQATRSGHAIPLTTTQFNILYTLAKAGGRVLSRDQLLDQSYDDPDGHDIFDRTIDAHIKSIRRSLEPDPAHPKYIQTVIGRGYRFSGGNNA